MLKKFKRLFATLLLMFVIAGEIMPMPKAYAATSTAVAASSASGYKLGKEFTIQYGKTVKFSNELSIKFYGSRLWDTKEVSFDLELIFKNKKSESMTLVYTPAEVGDSFHDSDFCNNYKIKVTNAVHKKSVTLIVTKPKKYKSAVMSGSADESYTAKNDVYFEDDRFILYVPKGITLRQDTMVMINEVMNLLEEKTGWKFMSIPIRAKVNTYVSYGYENGDEYYWNVNPDGSKIQIYLVEDFDRNGYVSNVFSNVFTYVYSKEYDNGVLSPNTVAHELAHVLQNYNLPSAEDSDTFTEGFAMALAYQITEEVKDKYPECSINYIITSNVESNPDGSPSPITKKTAQKLFEHNYRIDPEENMQQRNYQIGGALNLYILEKHGAAGFVKLKKKMNKMGFIAKTDEEVWSDPNYKYPTIADYSKALKSTFGKNFFKNFATWFKKNKERLLINWYM